MIYVLVHILYYYCVNKDEEQTFITQYDENYLMAGLKMGIFAVLLRGSSFTLETIDAVFAPKTAGFSIIGCLVDTFSDVIPFAIRTNSHISSGVAARTPHGTDDLLAIRRAVS